MLATIGVLVLTTSGGEFPAIALSLAALFAAYGVIRKRVVIGAMPGLFVETVVLVPVALVWLGALGRTGDLVFATAGPGMTVLLLVAGPLTVIPLLFFALATRRLRLTTIGFLQFLAPTLQFCVGLYYGEELTVPRTICFVCIWCAVAVFSIDAVKQSRRRQLAPAA